MPSKRRPSPAAGEPVELPVLPATPPPLRADAARNRAKLLAAAADLFERRGVDHVSLDEIVASAGVGKGTLYRIFGDKAGLAVALLDDRERTLQRRILSGTAPLGPDAAPRERLSAFVTAYVSHVAKNLELVRMSQTSRPMARFDTGSHRFWRAHLTYLLRELRAADPALVADTLLAAMSAEQIEFWTRRARRSSAAVARVLSALAAGVARPA